MKTIAALLLMTTVAVADDTVMVAPVIPTEEMKVIAIMRAYEANGKSMVGWGSYDATVPPARVVKTEKVLPTPPVPLPPERVVVADAKPDICKRHGMRKVASADGSSWRCRK